MAQGDSHWAGYFSFKATSGASYNASSNLKIGIVTTAATPSAGMISACWGTGGDINYSAVQVATAGTSYNGPITCTSITYTYDPDTAKASLGFANITVAADASGFTNAGYAMLYLDSGVKPIVGFIDLGGPKSIAGGALNINLNAGGFGTRTAS